MRRKLGNMLMAAGGFLILCAVIVLGVNFYHEYKAGKEVDRILPILESKIRHVSESQTPESGSAKKGEEISFVPEEVIIDGNVYIGILSVPSLELDLPVIRDYSDANLNIAPCLYSGSYLSDDMVIAGHNYRKHFSRLRKIPESTEIDFRCINGDVIKYRVLRVETIEPTQIEYLKEKDEESQWDLSLFTCSMSGADRCVVRCIRVEE